MDNVDKQAFFLEADKKLYEESAPSSTPAEIFTFGEMPQDVLEHHAKSILMQPFYYYTWQNVIIGGGGILSKNGNTFAPEYCFPSYIESMLENSPQLIEKYWLEALYDSNVKTIHINNSIYMPFHPNYIYGHFIVETLPKLLTIREEFENGKSHPVALPLNMPTWARNITEYVLPHAEFIAYNPFEERLLVDSAIIPPMMQQKDHFHPRLKHLIDKFLLPRAPEKKNPQRKIYLSRKNLNRDTVWHFIEDEQSIENIFQDYGYDIVYPETLSFHEQIELYRNCICIAGEYSSALHNSLFSQDGTVVISLNWINWIQSRISALKNQPVVYISPIDGIHDWRSQHGGSQKLHFDVDLLQKALTFVEGKI